MQGTIVKEPEITTWEVVRTFETRPELPEIGTTPVARRLIYAAMLLERDGWCQVNLLEGKTGRRCLVGAMMGIGEASTWNSRSLTAEEFEVVDACNDVLGLRVLNIGAASLTAWNDEQGRTAEQVIGALMEAARRSEAK